MIEGICCLDEMPHIPHEVVLTVDYPCSGPIECGKTENHQPHRIIKSMDAHCPGEVSL